MNNNSLPIRRPELRTDLDKILDFMLDMTGQHALDPRLEKMHERINFAYNELNQNYQDADVATLLMKRYDISKSTAYNDIRNARYIFGEIGPVNLNYEIRQLLQISTQNIKWAVDEKNVKSLTKAIEARVNILKLVREKESIDWDRILPSQYIIVFNAGEAAVKVDLNDVNNISGEKVTEMLAHLNEHFDALTIELTEDKNGIYTTGEAAPPESTAGDSSTPGI